MTEEQFNTELQSIKNSVINLLHISGEISYQMLLHQLSSITYQNAESKVALLFYFLVDSYNGDKSINDRLFILFAPFRRQEEKKAKRE